MVDDLADEVEVPFEVARVYDADNDVGRGSMVCRAEEDVGCDPLVGRSRNKAVCPRQIKQSRFRPFAQSEAPFLPLDGHAGIVADSLPEAGQGVKQRRLAGIRIAHERNQADG